jgi:V/A-type H+-transporting ATPase subunit A
MKRQAYMLNLVLKVCDTDLSFESYEELQPYYTKLINTLGQMNYQPFQSDDFRKYEAQLDTILDERRVK